jgi:hypothetical protein
MEAFKNFYNNYGKTLWGSYGFKDAFNPDLNWTAGSYISIDQAPIIIMVENFRSNLIWNMFMANEEIKPMMDAIGFEIIDNVEDEQIKLNYKLYDNYPNPFNPDTIIEYSIPTATYAKLIIYDVLGQKVDVLVNEYVSAGFHKTSWNAGDVPSGVYFYELRTDKFRESKKMMLIR